MPHANISHPMPRIATILLWLLLALGVTLASILLPALNFSRIMRPSNGIHYIEGGNTPLAWFIPPPPGTGKPYSSITLSSLGYSETTHTTSGMHSGGDSGPWAYTQCRTSVGFPFTALRHIEQEGDAPQTPISQHPLLGLTITISRDFLSVSSPLPRGTLISSALRFPRSIFLPGLIGNCIFWCGTLLLLRRVFRQFLHSRRRTKGLCRSCGFDLAQLPRCPECGTPAPNPCPAPPPS